MHEDLLLWCAGRQSPPAEVQEEDWPAVLKRVKDHRLTTRLFARISTERPSWLPDDVEAQLRSEVAHCVDVKNAYVEQIHKLDRLLDQADVAPIVTLKGPSAWAHTGYDHQVVTTKDIDAVARDAQATEAALVRVGYRLLVDRMPHEFAKLLPSPPDWGVELHNYLPVWSYTAPLSQPPWVEPPLRSNPVGVKESAALAEALLAEHALNAFRTRHGRVLVPDLTDCVLIRCAHIMHDYVEPPYFLADNDKFRFYELAEIRELSAENSFDRERFERSVRDIGAADCIRLVNQLFEFVYGEAFLPAFGVPEDGYLPPTQLCWGINVSVRREPRQSLQENATLDELFEAEPPTHVTVLPDGEAQTWSTRSDAGAPRFERLLVNWSPKRETELDLTMSIGPDTLNLVLDIAGPPGAFLEEVEVIFPTTRLYTAYEVSRESYRLPDESVWGTVEWSVGPAGCRVTLAIPRSTVQANARSDGTLPLVLAVERFQRTVGYDWNEFFADNMVSCAIPLVLHGLDQDWSAAAHPRQAG
jgi:hypothetical protein